MKAMKLLYIYDLKFEKYKGKLYSKNFTSQTWKKYIEIASSVTAYIKIIDKNELPTIQEAELENIHFIDWQSKTLFEKAQAIQSMNSFDFTLIRLPSKLGLFFGCYAILSKKPYAVEVVGNFYEALNMHGSFRNKLLAWPLHIIMKKIVNSASAAVYVSSNYLQEVYPNRQKSFIVPNAIIQQRPYKFSKKKSIQIGMIGSLDVNYKGHRTLFEALEKLDLLGIKMKVSLLGEGTLTFNKLFDFIEVEHLGILSGEALNNWFEQQSIYVQPSLTEAGGRSVLEAMSYGIPTIGSNVGGIPEHLSKEALFEKGDANGLYERLKYFLENDKLMMEQSIRNYQYAQQFTIENNQKKRNEVMNFIKRKYVEEVNHETIS